MQSIATYDLMVLAIGAIAFGFYLLVKGGDWAIDAAVYMAEKAGMSKLFVGATILAFGTSIPELFASVNANLSGFPGISLGNVLGSNIANILLVLGATAIIFPVVCKIKDVKADMIMMVVASAALYGAMQMDVIPRAVGIGMFAVLIGFVFYQYRQTMAAVAAGKADPDVIEAEDAGHDEDAFKNNGTAFLFLIGGFVALAIGSELLVKGAVTIGTLMGVPEAIIGTTVVAFGTSLPELATCILAAMKRHTEVIIGNIIGSNVFNILSIVGITAMIKPIAVDQNLTGLTLIATVAIAALTALWVAMGRSFGRISGIVMCAVYVAYIFIQYI